VTLTLGALLGKDMTTVRLYTLETTRGGLPEALRGTAIRFHLRHCLQTPITTSDFAFSLGFRRYHNKRLTGRLDRQSPADSSLLLLLRSDDHHHLATFHLRELFYSAQFGKVTLDSLE
jgi:hypothetical protein